MDKNQAIKAFEEDVKTKEQRQVYPTINEPKLLLKHSKKNKLRAAKAASR